MFIPKILLSVVILVALLLLLSSGFAGQQSIALYQLFIVGLVTIIGLTWSYHRKQVPQNQSVDTEDPHQNNISRMAEELERLRRYHKQILLDLPLGVCSINRNEDITMWNRTLEKITRLSSENTLGLKLTELREPWLSLLHNFLISEYTHLYKLSFDLEGKKHTVNLHKSAIEDQAGKDVGHNGVLILLEDITETEILEAGLTHSERLASIGRLAAGVAHEIGNPITGIACLAQNIRDENQDEELQVMANQIIDLTKRTSKIVQSLVNFAHAGTTKSDSQSEIIPVHDCIDEAITLVSLDKKGKSIRFDVHCEPDIRIMGDSQRLLQVLLNLINNSRDASQPDGCITLRCSASNATVQIVVEDDGIGISSAIRDRIFDPFFTTKEAGEGTGLGLSLVFSIVEDLNGNIDIISPTKAKLHRGTRVILSFPAFGDSSMGQHATMEFKPDLDAEHSEGPARF